MQNNEKDIYAGFFARLAAYLIDSIILLLLFAIPNLVVYILGLTGSNFFLLKDILFNFSLWDIIEYLLGVTYFVLFTYFSGATLGKMALRIKVVAANGEKPGFFDILFRETIGKYLSALILNLGYLLICVDKEKRGLQDILADTRVVYACKFKVYQEIKFFQTPVNPLPAYPQAGQQQPYSPAGQQQQPYSPTGQPPVS